MNHSNSIDMNAMEIRDEHTNAYINNSSYLDGNLNKCKTNLPTAMNAPANTLDWTHKNRKQSKIKEIKKSITSSLGSFFGANKQATNNNSPSGKRIFSSFRTSDKKKEEGSCEQNSSMAGVDIAYQDQGPFVPVNVQVHNGSLSSQS